MTVAELIARLETLPRDHEVYFRGYSCGSVWHNTVSILHFREATHLDDGREIVEIDAEWN